MLLVHYALLVNFRRIQTGVTVIPVSGGLIRVEGEILFALHALATPHPLLLVKPPPIAHVWRDFLDPMESHARNAPRTKFARVVILYYSASYSVRVLKNQQTLMHVLVYQGTFLSISPHRARLAPPAHTARAALRNYLALHSQIQTHILKPSLHAIVSPVIGVIVFR